MEIDVTALVPMVTLIAALLAGAIAGLTLIVNKENKISEFRQAWIDGLREDLANFLSASRTCTRAVQEIRFSWSKEEKNPLPIDESTTTKLRHQAAECSYRIRLRLNQKKQPHIELERLMTSSTTLVSQYFNGSSQDVNAVLEGIDCTATQAREVLKTEWERVKKGELAYRAAKWFAVSLVLITAALIFKIGTSKPSLGTAVISGASSAQPISSTPIVVFPSSTSVPPPVGIQTR